MRKLFLAILLLTGLVSAKPYMVVAVHPDCLHCQAWEKDWKSKDFSVKDQLDVVIKQINNLDDVQWMNKNVKQPVYATPYFFIFKDTSMSELLGSFSGYSSIKKFEDNVKKIIEKAQN